MANLEKPTIDQIAELMEQIKSGRVNRANMQAFLRDPDQSFRGILERMIAECGFDWANSDITFENFPVISTDVPDEELVEVHLDREVSTDEVLAYMEAEGLVPAEIHYLLKYAQKHPDKQREYPIVGLGSSWTRPGGCRYSPCLYGDASSRSLDLYWIVGRWRAVCRFLARRKRK